MKFVSIRDLRNKSAQIQKELPEEKEIVITSNGKPVALLCVVSGDTLEETLIALRRARAITAVSNMQMHSMKTCNDRITLEEINKEISDVRKTRKSL
ncbi:type II toxin-antitoxin system prevent-host-death family antitoxin [bacterium]|nr:type II toxin-antitoxin system prevent-host-death family antitoxin [bacterium]